MRSMPAIAVLCFLCLVSSDALSQNTWIVPEASTVLSTLTEGHPRLMMSDADLDRLTALRKDDRTLDRYFGDVIRTADEYLEKPVLSYTPARDRRLLSVARECMHRMYALGAAWRITGDGRYAEKARVDLLAACSFENWTPSLAIIYPDEPKYRRNDSDTGRPPFSFLDVSEMCHAVSIGYDWLYGYLSEDDRAEIRAGLMRHGLEEGIIAYTGKGTPGGKPAPWVYYEHNWNLVCNGGLIVGALAVAETDPKYAKTIIPAAVASLPRALATYGPDGAWPEGPSYWGYATQYAVFGLAALESALGTDYGLSKIKGLSETGMFPLLTSGPTGMYLNYADSPERNRRASFPCMFWLARKFGNTFLSDIEHGMIAHSEAGPFHLAWYVPQSGDVPASLDLDKRFRGPVELAVFRSAWNDPDALFVGIKGGDNTFNHAQLDLGTFEMDALGVRWVRDLGRDSYSLPGYFDFYYLTGKRGGKRWTYYRNGSFSHSVPLLGGEGQDELANGGVTAFSSASGRVFAILDLTEAYRGFSRTTNRGIRLVDNRRAILVMDEFDLTAACDLSWGMTTDADITTDGAVATLRQEGKTLTARILSPEGAVFTVESAEQEPPQSTNDGVKRLMIRMKRMPGSVRIAVLLSPHWPDGRVTGTTGILPLAEW